MARRRGPRFSPTSPESTGDALRDFLNGRQWGIPLSHLQAGPFAQSQGLHQVITKAALQGPSHCREETTLFGDRVRTPAGLEGMGNKARSGS